MRRGTIWRAGLPTGLAAVLLAVSSVAASAQGAVGLGARFAVDRPVTPAPSGTPRFTGGLLRGRLSPRTAVELAIDYRSQTLLSERVRSWPIQGSVLLYPVRSTVSVYVLGGMGWYFQRVDTLVGAETVASVSSHRTGTHAGLGGELQLGPRVTWHLDYRYTFIGFGDESPAHAGGAVPIPGLIALQEKLKLRHEAAMWTTGVTFYF